MDENIKNNEMSLTFIIIGKNTSNTLLNCIFCIDAAVLNNKYVGNYEIIYIDSKSSDDSVRIAKKYTSEVIEIINGYTTASLGRYLGKKYAKFDNLLFIDGDMYLDKNWFNNSLKYYEKYRAIIGERHEKLYRDNKVIKEIPKFYNINEVETASNIGGFLMIKKELIEGINYTPLIKNEEEKDFYAKFYDIAKIYRIPVTAYIHNNYNLSTSRIKDYLNPYAKNGYILSFINSIKNRYLRNYFSLQRKYIVDIIVSIIFYLFILSGNVLLGAVSLVLLLLNGEKQLKGSLATTLFFPYKLIMSLVFLMKKRNIMYKYENNEYILDIRL